ncbi:DnaB-like helicase N-terminal domain-containing protein (plasmid) [Borreliella yangtzensis]|uniref:DnaB-like helicase N-terminal domain-containing protein n=1 Tax=Borreliella yangtzensis TaxID=683292 RepID=UPI003B9F4CF0
MQNCVNSKDIIEKFNLSNLDSESIVIGSLLNNTVEIEEVILYLRPEDFSGTVNQKVFACMIDLHQKGLSIDPNIVLEELEKERKSNKFFSDFEVNEFVDNVSKYAMTGPILETHCKTIRDNSVRRAIVEFGNSVSQAGFDKSKDLVVLIDNIQNKANSLSTTRKNKKLLTTRDLLEKLENRFKNRNFTKNNSLGIGFTNLDNAMGSLGESNFVVIGASPNVDRTAFALNIANNLCKQNRSVGFFSLESPHESIPLKLISINAGVEYHKICNNSLMDENERQMYHEAHAKLKN